MKPLRIATRKSALALWQTNYVKHLLQQHYPEWSIVLIEIITTGDKIQDRPLADIGGKGLFIKALEQALLAAQADIAVHSMKDVPAGLEPGFTIAAITERANPLDALISPKFKTIADLPNAATVGTSSPRRRAQLLAH